MRKAKRAAIPDPTIITDGPLPGTIEVTDEIFLRPSDAKPGFLIMQVTEDAVVILSPADRRRLIRALGEP